MKKFLILPDNSVVREDTIVMVSDIEPQETTTGSFWKKTKKTEHKFSVIVAFTSTKVEEIEFIFSTYEEAKVNKELIIDQLPISGLFFD